MSRRLSAAEWSSLPYIVTSIDQFGWESRGEPWEFPKPPETGMSTYVYDAPRNRYLRTMPFHHLLLVTAGSIQYESDEQTYTAGEGQLIHLVPYRRHRIRSNGEPFRYAWIHYRLFVPERHRSLPPTFQDTHVAVGSADALAETSLDLPVHCAPEPFRQAMIGIVGECFAQEPGYLTAARGHLQILLAALVRESMPAERPLKTLSRDPLVDRALVYMHEHFADSLLVEQIAGVVNLSVGYFVSRFREATGFSPVEYLIRIRVDQSKRLLQTSAYSLTDIAAMCGFNSLAYYSRVFHHSEGCSPSVYRRRFRAGES